MVDLLIVDPHTNKVLPTGQIGELWMYVPNIHLHLVHVSDSLRSRGPNVMRGYYNNPKATKEAITRDGWFKSGDLATRDEEGFVYIKDRGNCNIHGWPSATDISLF